MCKLSRVVRGAVPLGRNLVLTRATNKGAVAIALPVRLPSTVSDVRVVNGKLTLYRAAAAATPSKSRR